jgi:hypothetical protein
MHFLVEVPIAVQGHSAVRLVTFKANSSAAYDTVPTKNKNNGFFKKY